MIRHICLIVLLIAFGTILFGAGIGKRDLWSPDEPRFGQVTREMLHRHDYFTLYQNNKVYDDKPPLYIWLAAAINGGDGTIISNAAMRSPSVIGGLMGLVVTYIFGLLLFNSWKTALASAAILATTRLYCCQANKAQLDMLMSGFSYIAMLCWWMANESSESRKKIIWWAGFWISAALGTLSKGPPALIIPLGTAAFFLMFQYDSRKAIILAGAWTLVIFCITVISKFAGPTVLWIAIIGGLLGLVALTLKLWIIPLWRISPRQVTAKLGLLIIGIALFAAVIAIWFIPYSQAKPQASQNTLITQTLTRYFQGMNHQAWVGFYLENLPATLIPWLLYFIAALILVVRDKFQMPRKQRLFLMTWMFFTLVFFSLSPSKRYQYLLPSMPAYALFLGWFLSAIASRNRREIGRYFLVPAYANAVLAIIVALGAIAAWAISSTSAFETYGWRAKLLANSGAAQISIASLYLWLPAILLVIAGAWLFLAARKRLVWQSVFVTIFFTVAIMLYRNEILFPALNPQKSGRLVSEKIISLRDSAKTQIGIFDFYRDDFVVYGDYFMDEIPGGKEAKRGDPRLHEFLQKPERVLLIMRALEYPGLHQEYPDLPMRPIAQIHVDTHDLVIVDNQPQLPGGIDLKIEKETKQSKAKSKEDE